MVLFQRGNNAAQHGHALRLDRLFHFHDLEAASQRGIFFKIFLVFGPGGGGDGAQFSARQGRLQQVRCVSLSRLSTRADHGVGFVDEQDDGDGRGFHFLDQALETVLEFTFDSRACLQQREIQSADRSRCAAAEARRPRATRSAKPSTTAVLPTPASPVRIGLFWRRRIRMSTTWRISKSRPSTGSILPVFAFSVRLMVNWSRLGVFPPGRGPADGAPGAAAAAQRQQPALLRSNSRRSRRSLCAAHRPESSETRG